MTGWIDKDPQELLRLVAQFDEDFALFYADERAAYDDFVLGSSPAQVAGALAGLDRLLATASTEEELGRRLNAMAFAYIVGCGGSESERAFLLRLRGWLIESISAEPPDEPA
jgi:hypothetical protein